MLVTEALKVGGETYEWELAKSPSSLIAVSRRTRTKLGSPSQLEVRFDKIERLRRKEPDFVIKFLILASYNAGAKGIMMLQLLANWHGMDTRLVPANWHTVSLNHKIVTAPSFLEDWQLTVVPSTAPR